MKHGVIEFPDSRAFYDSNSMLGVRIGSVNGTKRQGETVRAANEVQLTRFKTERVAQ